MLDSSAASVFIPIPSSGPEARHVREKSGNFKSCLYYLSLLVNHRPTARPIYYAESIAAYSRTF